MDALIRGLPPCLGRVLLSAEMIFPPVSPRCRVCGRKVWDNEYFKDLLEYDWVTAQSPANATQWVPVKFEDDTSTEPVPDIIMLTSDIALIRVRTCPCPCVDLSDNGDRHVRGMFGLSLRHSNRPSLANESN